MNNAKAEIPTVAESPVPSKANQEREKLSQEAWSGDKSTYKKPESGASSLLPPLGITDKASEGAARRLSDEAKCPIDDQAILDTELKSNFGAKLDKLVRAEEEKRTDKLYNVTKDSEGSTYISTARRDDAVGKAAWKEMEELIPKLKQKLADDFVTGLQNGEQGKESAKRPDGSYDSYDDGYSIGKKLKENRGSTTEDFNKILKELYTTANRSDFFKHETNDAIKGNDKYSKEATDDLMRARAYTVGLSQGGQTRFNEEHMSEYFKKGLMLALQGKSENDLTGMSGDASYSKEPATDKATLRSGFEIGKQLIDTRVPTSEKAINAILENYRKGIKVAKAGD